MSSHLDHDDHEGDAAVRALARLAEAHELRMPDAGVERRIARELASSVGPRPWLRTGWAAKFLIAVVLTGGAVAATGGWERLQRWWYSIQYDGHAIEGSAVDGESRTERFTTADGVEVSVTIERGRIEGGERTRIAVTERGEGTELESVVEEETLRGGPSSERAGIETLAGVAPLHRWRDASGERRAIYLIDDESTGGSLIAVHDVDSEHPRPVRIAQRAARRIGPHGTVHVVEHDGGVLALELDDGRGWALAFVLGVPEHEDAPIERPTEIETPHGRVRVDFDR